MFYSFVKKHAFDGQMDIQTDVITIPKTALASLLYVVKMLSWIPLGELRALPRTSSCCLVLYLNIAGLRQGPRNNTPGVLEKLFTAGSHLLAAVNSDLSMLSLTV